MFSLTWIREKFGGMVTGVIIGGIALVFVFYGVFNPKSTRGLHEGAVAGTVNGDPISIEEFMRDYNRRIEYFRNMTGGKLTDDQLKNFRLKEQTFQELVRKKLMVQEAAREGMGASDEEVLDRIREIPAFQKDGKFDFLTYKQLLEANSLSPAVFESQIKDDLSASKWQDYFRDRVYVSDSEIKNQFLVSEDKRDVKYVLLTTEVGKKGISIPSDEIRKFLADPSKLNLAKGNYDSKKDREFKGKSFDEVKESIAKDILAGEKMGEVQKVNQKLADQVVKLMDASKGSDAKVNAVLKPYGVQVKTTGFVTRENAYFPGIGESKELKADLFAKKSPINPADGGKAKIYPSAAWVLVAVVSDSKSPDLSKLESERVHMIGQVLMRKERTLSEEFFKKLMARAKVDANPSVVGDQG